MGQGPEVLIVGAGPAGISAALKLARAGVRTLVLEGAEFAGAENWSGGVYHAETLVREDVLGADAWARAPRERRIVARSLVVHGGDGCAGFEARAVAGNDYGEAWTVLRPRLDRYLAACAIEHGAVLLPRTTVTGLRFARGRVVGVDTARGPVEAPVVFLAEGDAAGVLAREGLERPVVRYAQGIKAVFALAPATIEARFGVGAGEGVAQEWLLRNGTFKGHTVALDMSGFLYTNRDTLSVGLVFPLTSLADHGPVDHPQLMRRFLALPEVAALLEGATQIAYGAKVIRAGGLREGVVCAYDGLAIGGASLGLGLEFPYPNFMGPAAMSGAAFADAVLALRGRGDYSAAALAEAYGGRLRQSPDYDNARLAAAWPEALHASPLIFEHLPALVGALTADPASRSRACARAAFSLTRDRATLRVLAALPRRALVPDRPPLAVTFLVARAGRLAPVPAPPAVFAGLAHGIGYLYGRGLPRLETRLAAAFSQRVQGLAVRMLARSAGLSATGALGFASDGVRALAAGRSAVMRAPFYRHERLARERLSWDRSPPDSPSDWLAPLGRPGPDLRHIHVPRDLAPADAQRLQRVCPAGVYGPGNPLGGASVVFENCIKCESCRLVVPAVDWRRTSTHRLIYELPGAQRTGPDGSVHGLPDQAPGVPSGTPPSGRAGGWARDIAAGDGRGPRQERPAVDGYAPFARRVLRDRAAAVFPSARLAGLVAGWTADDRQDLMRLMRRRDMSPEDVIAALAEYDSGLGFVALHHLLAEARCGRRLARLTIGLSREADGLCAWVPDVGADGLGGRDPLATTGAVRATGLDTARCVRVPAAGAEMLTVDPTLARYYAAFWEGYGEALGARADAHARARLQFAGTFRDREGSDGVFKFGAVKRLLAVIAYALALARRLRAHCDHEPRMAVALLQERFGVSLDGVAWCAGQVFGGIAYSEDDILSRRYRDAMVLTQWPAVAPAGTQARWERTLWTGPADQAEALFLRHGLGADADLAPLPVISGRLPVVPRPSAPIRYESGGFLFGRLLPADQAFVPEDFLADPALRRMRAQVLRLVRGGFRDPGGGAYGRYIDDRHAVPESDIARLKAFSAFATVIPRDLGGLGASKAEYAVLAGLLMGRVDPSVGLLVMASTSIGTMPVLLALQKDLPRLDAELAGLSAASFAALREGARRVRALCERPRAGALRKTLEAMAARIKDRFLKPGSALKYLARDVLDAFEAVVAAARARDLDALAERARAFDEQLAALVPRLAEERARLPVRIAAHERFLRFLARGQISAFALTEPSAGSDTGALTTRAEPRCALLSPGEAGLWRFVTARGPRVLLDERRLDFTAPEVRYRMPDGTWARLDDGVWDVAGKGARRRVVQDSGEVYEYDDRGVPQDTPDGPVYEYFELSGSKMWISNGSLADRYCLYAQTARGVTGFLVERRCEGLAVGRDERKLGQRASPTNEIALSSVRVCASRIIGFEGHGQVNALETLSVGRGGLVVGAGGLLERLITDYLRGLDAASPALARARYEHERLRALGARLVGLMDRADLCHGDFRIEAALSKFLASEGLHRVLRALEIERGPSAAAMSEPIEKWRRDARILNIYEGTNEVQRFLVLKDLPALFARFEAMAATGSPALDRALRSFSEFLRPRLTDLKARVGADGDAQILWFPVVDWVAELYAWAVQVERRLALAARGAAREGLAALEALETVCEQAVGARARAVHALFAEASAYEQAVVALANRRTAEAVRPAQVLAPGLRGHVLVLVRDVRHPDARDVRLDDEDLAVLDQALAAGDGQPALDVTAVLVTAAPCLDHAQRLRAAGARVQAVITGGLVDPAALVPLIARLCPDLILAGPSQPVFLAARAGALNTVLVDGVTGLATAGARGYEILRGAGRRLYVTYRRLLVACGRLPATGRSDAFTVGQWLGALQTAPFVERLDGAAADVCAAVSLPAAAPGDLQSPEALAQWLRAGIGGAPPAVRPVVPGVAHVATVMAVAGGGARGRACAGLARAFGESAGGVWLARVPGESPPEGLSGPLFRVPATGADASLAEVLAPRLADASYIVLGPEDAALGGALAARLARPLYIDVEARRGDDLVCVYAARRWRTRCPGRAVLVAASGVGGTEFEVETTCIVEDWAAPEGHPGRFAPVVRATCATGLAGAEVVIDVGRGVADGAFFQRGLMRLKSRLSAMMGCEVAFGATRKVVQESGLLPFEHQIGQTGIHVAPRLLLALGVSGAPQHMVGIAADTQIVAINLDPQAPIFAARAGGRPVVRCVGDARAWVEALLALWPEVEGKEAR